ncbi:MAG: nucleotide exchange factor GrpE [Patescibacteria group bacterium]
MTKKETTNKGENKEKNDQNQKEDKNELEKLKAEKEEYLNGWKRARADFSNYKKNEKARIEKARKQEKKKLILEVLEVLDNFYLAEDNIDKDKVDENYLSGFSSIKKQLENLLNSYGVEEISAVGEDFDPNLHEAVAMVEIEDANQEEIIEVVRKGYLMDGELLRPARVKVAK